ncbi:MAG: hypothetical protein ABIP89_16005 [Polyangiaceae bacterium]
MRALVLCFSLLVGCSSTTVPLLSAAGAPMTLTPLRSVPLEVVTRGTGVRDPMVVSGAGVKYADVETALGFAVSSAAVPWADAHQAKRPGGWQLFVELIQAESDYREGRLIVTLSVRATLRARDGHQYLAQTQASCRQSGLVAAEDGAPVIYSCMSRVGRDLAGWLGSIEP